MHSIGQLAVRVKVLHPEDSVGKAAEALRASAMGAVPVVRFGRLAGLLTAAILAEFLLDRAPEQAKHLTVDALPLEVAIALPEGMSAADGLQFLRANEIAYAPVVDAGGGLIGMVSEAEVVSGVCRRVRPPLVGGMATPFGVYLTGGGVRGGVGDLALMSTGVFMGVLNLVAAVIADWFLAHASWSDPILHLVARFGPGAAEGFKFYLPLILFALLFRLTWVTGYHAAEHQVVHAIEAGDDLLPEVVRRKPRVHPRCGTNLVVAVFLMSAFWNWRSGPLGDMAVVVAMLCTFFLWRRIGAVVQQYITTRPANRRQIESGILAGEQLMERYQDWPYGPQTGWQRIWNMGLLQVFGGFMLVLGLLFLLQLAHVPLPEITL